LFQELTYLMGKVAGLRLTPQGLLWQGVRLLKYFLALANKRK
jgi:hypothetical protein